MRRRAKENRGAHAGPHVQDEGAKCERREGEFWAEKNARGAHVLAHSLLELFCSNFHSGYLHVHLHRADAFMNVLRTVWHIETLFSQRLSRFTKSQKGSDRSKTVGQLSRVLA